MQRLTFVGPINGYTGYGLHALQIVQDIERLTGAYVSVRATSTSESFGVRIPHAIRQRLVSSIQPEPWELLLHPPNCLPTPGKRTVYFSMWESTRLQSSAVQLLNAAEVVAVPSEFCANTFSACGVRVPIHIVTLGINPEVFTYRHPRAEHAELCVFGAAGRMAHGSTRKGINDVMDAFRLAFPRERDVRLRVKGFTDCPLAKVNDWRVEVTQAYLDEWHLAEWFAGLTCFVSACRGEGWGLMQQQAMAVGRPIISINWGGVREYFDRESSYELDYRLEPATGLYANCGLMATPDRDSMIEQMRRVYADRQSAIDKGQRASAIARQFTWEKSSQKLIRVLRTVGAL